MYCKKCGKQLPEGAAVCPECGAQVEAENAQAPKQKKPLPPILARVKENGFDKIVDFKGRMSCKEYWLWILSAYVIAVVLACTLIGSIVSLAACVGMVSATVRRLHDMGKRTLDILFGLIPFAGPVFLIIWCTKPSVQGANEFGPQPEK